MRARHSGLMISPKSAAYLFSAGTIVFIAVAIWCNLLWTVLWVDFIHFNPHRSQSNALLTVFFLTPFASIFIAVNSAFPLLGTGLSAYLLAKRFGCVPLWSLIALAPASLLLLWCQNVVTPTLPALSIDGDSEPIDSWTLAWSRWRDMFAPALLMSWISQIWLFGR